MGGSKGSVGRTRFLGDSGWGVVGPKPEITDTQQGEGGYMDGKAGGVGRWLWAWSRVGAPLANHWARTLQQEPYGSLSCRPPPRHGSHGVPAP